MFLFRINVSNVYNSAVYSYHIRVIWATCAFYVLCTRLNVQPVSKWTYRCNLGNQQNSSFGIRSSESLQSRFVVCLRARPVRLRHNPAIAGDLHRLPSNRRATGGGAVAVKTVKIHQKIPATRCHLKCHLFVWPWLRDGWKSIHCNAHNTGLSLSAVQLDTGVDSWRITPTEAALSGCTGARDGNLFSYFSGIPCERRGLVTVAVINRCQTRCGLDWGWAYCEFAGGRRFWTGLAHRARLSWTDRG